MKVYIQHNDHEPIFPIGFDEVAQYLSPEDWCEVDKLNYELEMDNEHRVYLSFVPFKVNYDKCEKDIETAIKCVLADIYGGQHFPDTHDN